MTSRMLTLIALGFVLIVGFAEMSVRMFAESLPDPRAWPSAEVELKVRQLESSGGSVEAIFVGSSVTEAGIDPEIIENRLHMAVYNAALPFSSPISNRVWIEDVLLELIAPRLVVIGVPSFPMTATVATDPLKAGLEAALSSSDQWAWSALLAQRANLRNWRETRIRMEAIMSDFWTNAGHQTGYYDQSITASERVQRLSDPVAQSFSDDNLAALRDIVRTLRARNTDVAFILEPVGCLPSFGECVFERPPDAVHPASKVAQELSVPVVDLYSVEWPQSYFADSVHFNRSGVVALSEIVAAELALALSAADS